MLRLAAVLALLALTVYAASDCAMADSDTRGGVPRWLWIVLILVPVLGPIVWLVVSRRTRVDSSPRVTPPAPAPDDNPDFLRDLNWDVRRAQRRASGTNGSDRRDGQTEGSTGPSAEPEEPDGSEPGPRDGRHPS